MDMMNNCGNIDEIIMEFLTGKKIPETNEDYLVYEQEKIFKSFLTDKKFKRKELFPINQWKKALNELLPCEFKDLLSTLNLIDIQLTEKIDYNRIIEECYNNITKICDFAIMFKEKREIIDKPFPPVVIANIYKHLAIGLIAEVEKFHYYTSDRQLKVNIM